jgi:hypothetical protein
MADIARGLHAAHELRGANGDLLDLVHRDVSPSNIFCLDDGQFKLLDFGIAWAKERRTQTRAKEIKGKIGYMAPEQIEGRADRRTDIWALGVVLWEALIGEPLFDTGETATTIMQVHTRTVPLLTEMRGDVPDAIADLAAAMLQRAPTDRPPTALAVADALESYLRQCGPNTRPENVAHWLRSVVYDRGPAATNRTGVRTLDEAPPAPTSDQDLTVIDLRSPIERWTDGRGTDERGPEARWTDERGPEARAHGDLGPAEAMHAPRRAARVIERWVDEALSVGDGHRGERHRYGNDSSYERSVRPPPGLRTAPDRVGGSGGCRRTSRVAGQVFDPFGALPPGVVPKVRKRHRWPWVTFALVLALLLTIIVVWGVACDRPGWVTGLAPSPSVHVHALVSPSSSQGAARATPPRFGMHDQARVAQSRAPRTAQPRPSSFRRTREQITPDIAGHHRWGF